MHEWIEKWHKHFTTRDIYEDSQFRQFRKEYIHIIMSLMPEYEYFKVEPMPCVASVFAKNKQGRCIYITTTDLCDKPIAWLEDILIAPAAYIGSYGNFPELYTTLHELPRGCKQQFKCKIEKYQPQDSDDSYSMSIRI